AWGYADPTPEAAPEAPPEPAFAAERFEAERDDYAADPRLTSRPAQSQVDTPTEEASLVDSRLSPRPSPSPYPTPEASLEPELRPESELDSGPSMPPTHGRGVRMAIYSLGGAVVVGLVVTIIIMAGGSLPSLPGAGNSDDESEITDGIFNADGEIDPEAYASTADSAGGSEWFDWLHGPAADSKSDAAEVEAPETSEADYGDGIARQYQHGDAGAPEPTGNVQGQLAFTADDDSAGVDHVTVTETTQTSIGFSPRSGGRFSTDAPEVDLAEGPTSECLGGSDLGRVVAVDRADGGGQEAHSVMAFSSGAVATAGISGAQGGTCMFLPEGMRPTSVTVTPANEFALITVWDVEEVRGRVAVVALGDTPGTYETSWPSLYPGLPNPGHFSFAKLLGFVELSEMKAPTGIAASTDYAGEDVTRVDADLSDVEGRAAYAEGAAKSGYAVVASAAENKVEWIDLSPLLSGFATAYFEGDAAVYAEPGGEADQWPQTFEAGGDYAPAATGSVDAEHPSAVAATADGAYVATGDGNAAVFDSADPAAPAEAGSIELPGPATCLTHTVDGEQLLATSRADRSVSWVEPGDGGGEVKRTLRDSRLVDPLCAADAALEGDDAQVRTVSVADYDGTLHTYRYGPGLLAGADLSLADDSFEYGGGYQPAGKPFAVSTTVDFT
ncbi:MAG: hypothetical protein ACRDXX_08465, partial [Stackebrandtia sp.]